MKHATSESLTIVHNKKRIMVRPLIGNDDRVVVDTAGAIYCSWWPTPDDLPTTPKQRSRYRYKAHHRAYRKFADGLVSFERGLHYALVSGDARILTHQEWEELLKDTQLKCSLLESSDDALKEELKGNLASVAQALGRVSSLPLQEARHQLTLAVLFEDSLHRFNVGVITCRTQAAFDRVRERLTALRAWSSDYHDRLTAVRAMNRQFAKALERFADSLKTSIDQLHRKEVPYAKRITALSKQLAVYEQYFMRWTHIKPYSAWARHTIDDIRSAQFRLELNDLRESSQLLVKMLRFTGFKRLQGVIDQHIFDLSFTFDKETSQEVLYRVQRELKRIGPRSLGQPRFSLLMGLLSKAVTACNDNNPELLRKELKKMSQYF